MQLLGRTFTAQELVDCGLISRLIPSDKFRESVLEIASEASKFSIEAVKVTKELIRGVDRELLLDANQKEMTALGERMASSDSLKSIMKFLGKKVSCIQPNTKHKYYRGSSCKKGKQEGKVVVFFKQ